MNNNLLHTLAIIFAAGIVLVGIIAALDKGPGGDSSRTISVNGEATRAVAADKAIVTLSIITEHEDANTARVQNAERAQQVVSALRDFGTVETAQLYINPVYEPGRDEVRDPRIQLYRVTNTVSVTLTDLTRIGAAIDSATSAGANQVQNVHFSVSDNTRNILRTELLQEASRNARSKADSIATGFDERVGSVQSVSEESVYFPTFARAESMTMDATTPIQPQELEVHASIHVAFTLR